MGVPSSLNIERVPGVLIKNPTNLALPPYYGGTVLGAARGCDVDFMDRPSVNYLEEYKGAPGDALEGPEWCVLYAALREFTSDSIRAIFPKSHAGATGEVIDGSVSASPRAGTRRSARSYVLLYAPNEYTQAGLLIYNAMPIIVEGNRTAFSVLHEQVLSVSWMSMPDATKRTYKFGPVGDMVL